MATHGNTTHGHSIGGKVTPTYQTWYDMRNRCANPNVHNFHRYGGRGITVCERWSVPGVGFSNFLADMGEKPDGLLMNRINYDGNYEPDNCRWSTQQGELHPNHKLTWEKVRAIRDLKRRGPVTQRQLAKRFGVTKTNIFLILSGKAWKEETK